MGILYRNSFIMYDRGTESHWVHTTGECIQGKFKGKQLTFFPSVITTWGQWKKQQAETTVLTGEGVSGFMGTYTMARDPSKFGISVGQGKLANLYRIRDLKKQRVVHDKLGEKDIVVFFDEEGTFATAYENPDGQKFNWDGKQFLDANGKAFNMMLGTLDGQDTAERLAPIPATAWLVKRWKGFYPDQKAYRPPGLSQSRK